MCTAQSWLTRIPSRRGVGPRSSMSSDRTRRCRAGLILRATTQTRDVSGWGDPRLRVSINLHGAPALALREIGSYRQDLIVGASLTGGLRSASTTSSKLSTSVRHRWSVKPEIGLSKATRSVDTGADRRRAVLAATMTSSRTGRANRIRSIPCREAGSGPFPRRVARALRDAFHGRAHDCGRRARRGLQENSRIGLTFSMPLTRNNSLKLYANTGVSTRAGSDFDAVGLAWQYRWGGGL